MTKYPLVIGMFLLVAAVAWMWNYAPAVQPVRVAHTAPSVETKSAVGGRFSSDDVAKARGALQRLMELDGIRDISGESTVIVGNSFPLAEFETKRGMLVQAMVVRWANGRSTHFILREPMNHREVGYFKDGYLELK